MGLDGIKDAYLQRLYHRSMDAANDSCLIKHYLLVDISTWRGELEITPGGTEVYYNRPNTVQLRFQIGPWENLLWTG
jgi:hypothetical protein